MILIVAGPFAALELLVKVSWLLDVVDGDENKPVTPDGRFASDRDTALENPFLGLIAIVVDALVWEELVVRLAGRADKAKSAAGLFTVTV